MNSDRRRKYEKDERNHRKRKPYKFWDKAPKGFENMSPQQYKTLQANGQIPINVFAPGQVPMPDDVPNAPIVLHSDLPFAGSAVCRQARRLYVGNIPYGVTEAGITEFFNTEMKNRNLIINKDCEGDSPVLAVQINIDKNFSFIEFRSVEETTEALVLDGMIWQGQQLKLRRPRDYVPLPGISNSPRSVSGTINGSKYGVVSTQGHDSPHKIFIGCLPSYLNDEQIKELLETFGKLRAFDLIKDASTGLSKGYGFCEFADVSITDRVCRGLNGMQLGDKHIVVQRASLGSKQALNKPVVVVNGAGNYQPPTKCVCLMNMINDPSELLDDEEYDDITEDIKEECGKYGRIVSIEIPRPSHSSSTVVSGVGKIFIEFACETDAQTTVNALTGRKFNNRVVVTSFFDPDLYHRRQFN